MSIKKNLFWTFSSEYSVFFINFLISIVMARVLTPEDFGVFAIGLAITEFLALIRQVGIGRYIVQTEELSEARIRSALGVMIVFSWTFGILLFCISGLVAEIYHRPGLQQVICILASTFFLVPFSQPGMSLLERQMQFRSLLLLGTGSALISGAVSIAAALYGQGFLSMAIGSFALQLCYLLGVLFLKPEGQVFIPSLREWRSVLHFGFYVSLSNIINYLGSTAPTALLGKILDVTSVGLYSRAVSLMTMVRQPLQAALMRTMYPTFAALQNKQCSLTQSYMHGLGINMVFTWSICLVLGTIATPVVTFLYGDQWAASGHLFSFLCVAYAIQAVIPFYLEIMFVKQQQKLLLSRDAIINLFALINFGYWAIHGVNLAALSRSLDALLAVIIYAPIIFKLVDLNLREQYTLVLKSACVSIISAIPVLTTMLIRDWPNHLPPLLLIALAPMSFAFWVIGIFLARHPLHEDMMKVMENLRLRFVKP